MIRAAVAGSDAGLFYVRGLTGDTKGMARSARLSAPSSAIGSANDLAVSVTSAQALPLEPQPVPQIHVGATDHVSFFEDRASLDVVTEAVNQRTSGDCGNRAFRT